jgi:uncharacterized membrane protein YeaQ/YmgE (transglycosylase-associated protein family)
MDILFWIVLGLVMGVIARAILPGEQKMGLIMTTIVGAIGAFAGGGIAYKLGIDVSSPFKIASILSAIIGALIVLVIWCLIFKRSLK